MGWLAGQTRGPANGAHRVAGHFARRLVSRSGSRSSGGAAARAGSREIASRPPSGADDKTPPRIVNLQHASRVLVCSKTMFFQSTDNGTGLHAEQGMSTHSTWALLRFHAIPLHPVKIHRIPLWLSPSWRLQARGVRWPTLPRVVRGVVRWPSHLSGLRIPSIPWPEKQMLSGKADATELAVSCCTRCTTTVCSAWA